MKNIYAALLTIGAGVLGLGIGVVGAGVAGVSVGALGGFVGGTAVGICATTHVATEDGLLNDQQLDLIASGLVRDFSLNHPKLAEDLKKSFINTSSHSTEDKSLETGYPKCDLVLNKIQEKF